MEPLTQPDSFATMSDPKRVIAKLLSQPGQEQAFSDLMSNPETDVLTELLSQPERRQALTQLMSGPDLEQITPKLRSDPDQGLLTSLSNAVAQPMANINSLTNTKAELQLLSTETLRAQVMVHDAMLKNINSAVKDLFAAMGLLLHQLKDQDKKPELQDRKPELQDEKLRLQDKKLKLQDRKLKEQDKKLKQQGEKLEDYDSKLKTQADRLKIQHKHLAEQARQLKDLIELVRSQCCDAD